jgi:hypothetical protein
MSWSEPTNPGVAHRVSYPGRILCFYPVRVALFARTVPFDERNNKVSWERQYGGLRVAAGLVGRTLRVRCVGINDPFTSARATVAIERLARSCGLMAVLIDIRGLKRPLSPGECRMWASLMPPTSADDAPLVALLHSPGADPAVSCGERAIIMTGRLWTPFTSEDAALAWLRMHKEMRGVSSSQLGEVDEDLA